MLLAAGHEVVGLDSSLFDGCDFGNFTLQLPEVNKDLRDVQRCDLEGFDAVVHLAALCNDPLGALNPDLTYDINHVASVRLARLAKEVGASRFVFSSSCSTYGAAGDQLLDESAAFNPVTAYGRSKVLVESEVTELADKKFSPTFLRNATAYGVSPRLRLDVVLNDLVGSAFTTGRIYMKSDGTPWRPIVHVEDIGRAFQAVLQAPRELVHNEAFNVGATEENYQIRELAAIVSDIVPGSRIEYASDAGPDKRCYRVNFDKIRARLPEFRPQWNARRGAQQLYDAYRNLALTPAQFSGPSYRRVDHVRNLIASETLNNALRWTNRTPVLAEQPLRMGVR
jgi:nucleoside-diphosphate-sugar epimerase